MPLLYGQALLAQLYISSEDQVHQIWATNTLLGKDSMWNSISFACEVIITCSCDSDKFHQYIQSWMNYGYEIWTADTAFRREFIVHFSPVLVTSLLRTHDFSNFYWTACIYGHLFVKNPSRTISQLLVSSFLRGHTLANLISPVMYRLYCQILTTSTPLEEESSDRTELVQNCRGRSISDLKPVAFFVWKTGFILNFSYFNFEIFVHWFFI